MTAEERTAFLAAVGVLLPKVTEIVDLMEQLEQKTADFEPLLEAQAPLLRAAVKRAKTSAGCTPGIQEQMDWVATRGTSTRTPRGPRSPPRRSAGGSGSRAKSPASTR
jgi:hypothetical protein